MWLITIVPCAGRSLHTAHLDGGTETIAYTEVLPKKRLKEPTVDESGRITFEIDERGIRKGNSAGDPSSFLLFSFSHQFVPCSDRLSLVVFKLNTVYRLWV